MEIKALVLYRDHYALYMITRENHGIFTARLRRYDGDPGVHPPDCVTLTRSVRSWKGSTDEQLLIDELGEIIEIYSQSGLFDRKMDDSPSGIEAE